MWGTTPYPALQTDLGVWPLDGSMGSRRREEERERSEHVRKGRRRTKRVEERVERVEG